MNIGRATNEEILRAFPGSKISRVAESKLAPIKEKPKRKQREDRYASQAEADYAAYLDSLLIAGEVRTWIYEPIQGGLKLSEADPQTKRNRTYRPDFLVQWSDGYLEFVECKGGKACRLRWEDAIVKFDWARSEYKFWHFRMVEKINGEWTTIRGEERP